MSRITYLELPAIFIGALIIAVLLMAAWILLLIPAMFSTRIRGMGGLQDQITANVTKMMMKNALKGMSHP